MKLIFQRRFICFLMFLGICGVFWRDSAIANTLRLPPPIVVVGNIHSSNRIAFVWSHNCQKCRDEFRQTVFPAYLVAATSRSILFSFVEYEDSGEEIKQFTAPAVCGGKGYYDLYVLGSILNDLNTSDLHKLARQRNVNIQHCRNISEIETDLPVYFSHLKSKYDDISSLHGTVIINGKVETSRTSITDFLNKIVLKKPKRIKQ